MNKFFIEGRLGKDAETREVNGNRFLSFTIAENQYSGKEKKTFWYDVIAFSYNEKLVQYYKKGTPLFVVGQLTTDTETGKDGVVRCRRSISADSINFLDTGKSENGSSNTQQGENTKKNTPEPIVTTASNSSVDEDNSDLPF